MSTKVGYSLDVIRDETAQLVKKGWLERQQPIYTLFQYIPVREWLEVKRELELSEFSLREPIIDLLSQEEWVDD